MTDFKRFEEATNRGLVTPTLNHMGWMARSMDEFSTRFAAEISHFSTKNNPLLVMDLGIAFGYSTKKLLELTTGNIIANDLEPRHLERLVESLDEEEKPRVIIAAGKGKRFLMNVGD